MFDPDDFIDPIKSAEAEELDRTLTRLQDCDLGTWDQDFVDDLLKRMGKKGSIPYVTPRQWEQLERMRRQYL